MYGESALRHIVMKDTEEEDMRLMLAQMAVTSMRARVMDLTFFGQAAWSPSRTFQPPTHSQDLVHASHHDVEETMHESPAARETGHKVFSCPFGTY